MWKREKRQGVTVIHHEEDLTSHCWGLQAWALLAAFRTWGVQGRGVQKSLDFSALRPILDFNLENSKFVVTYYRGIENRCMH